MGQHVVFHSHHREKNLAVETPLYRSGAPYDRLVKTITSAAWIGLTFIDALIAYLALSRGMPLQVALHIVAITVAMTFSVLIGTFLFSPRRFELTREGLAVKRPLKSFVIPYSEIIAAKRVRIPKSGIRLFASGGLHGFFGLFQL